VRLDDEALGEDGEGVEGEEGIDDMFEGLGRAQAVQ